MPLSNLFSPLLAFFFFTITAQGIEEQKFSSNGEDLGLFIMGSIVNQDLTTNVVLLKNLKNQKVKALRQGQKIARNWTVEKIHHEYIILRNGLRKTSHLVYQNKFAGRYSKAGLQTAKDSPLKSRLKATRSQDGLQIHENEVVMTEDFRSELLTKKMESLLLAVTAVPHYSEGELGGFRLIQISQNSLYETMGFQNNDLVTSINGLPLDSITRTLTLLHQMKSENEIVIEFFRQGQLSKKTLMVR